MWDCRGRVRLRTPFSWVVVNQPRKDNRLENHHLFNLTPQPDECRRFRSGADKRGKVFRRPVSMKTNGATMPVAGTLHARHVCHEKMSRNARRQACRPATPHSLRGTSDRVDDLFARLCHLWPSAEDCRAAGHTRGQLSPRRGSDASQGTGEGHSPALCDRAP